jgi:predicted small lipoprotein YifL
MRNSFKIGVLAAAVMFSISSCSSCGIKNNGDLPEKADSPKTTIDTTQKAIDTTKKAELVR